MVLVVLIPLLDIFVRICGHTIDENVRAAGMLLFAVFSSIRHQIEKHKDALNADAGQLVLQQIVRVDSVPLEHAKKWLQCFIANTDPAINTEVWDIALKTPAIVNLKALYSKGYEYLDLVSSSQAARDRIASSEVSDGWSDEATGSVPSDSVSSERSDKATGSISSGSDLFEWFGPYVNLDENDPNI